MRVRPETSSDVASPNDAFRTVRNPSHNAERRRHGSNREISENRYNEAPPTFDM